MIKLVLQFMLPLIAPTLFYWAWRGIARYRAAKTGVEPHPFWESTPYFWLSLGGAVLLVISLISLALLSGSEPGSIYHAPVMLPDGSIQPGYHE